MQDAFRAAWVEERNLADAQLIAELLTRSGHDAEAVLALAASAPVQHDYRTDTEAAAASDLPGVPGYVLVGEAFLGAGPDRTARTGAGERSFAVPQPMKSAGAFPRRFTPLNYSPVPRPRAKTGVPT